MKTKVLFICLIAILSSKFCYSQSEKHESPTYDTCQSLQPLQGEWRFANAQDTIRVYLRAFRGHTARWNAISDELYGWVEYKHGNNIAYSNYADRLLPMTYELDSPLANNGCLVLSLRHCESSCNILGGSMVETAGPYLSINEAILNPGHTTLTWKQYTQQGYGGEPMILPASFILTKQP